MASLQVLQKELIAYYRTVYSRIPISPLLEEYSVPPEELYIQPRLEICSTAKDQQAKNKTKTLYTVSLRDVFFNDRNSPCKNIYVTGSAGMGKTAFLRKIAMIWCQGMHQVDQYKEKFKDEDIKVMKGFEVLFYLQVQEYPASCDLVDIISEMISRCLSGGHSNNKQFIETVLSKNRCMILLDGVDQWTHPDTCQRKHSESIPHNRFQGKCTVLTTLLPWTLSNLKLSPLQMDRKLEICDLTDRAIAEIEASAVVHLKGHESLEVKIDEFDDLIHAAKLEEARYKPYMLLQFICIWHDKERVGNTRFEAYTNIVEFTLNRPTRTHRNLRNPVVTENMANFIPKCIPDKSTCHKQFSLLFKIGNVAFDAICKELKNPDSTLDTDEVIRTRLLTREELDYFLDTGMVSQTKDSTTIAKVRHLLTFPHRLIQEYFAALYVATAMRIRTKRGSVLRKCWDLPDVFDETIARILKLIKDVSEDMFENISKMIKSGKRTTGENIRFIGKNLLKFAPGEAEDLIEDCVPENKIAEGSYGNTIFKSDKLQRCGVVAVKKCVVQGIQNPLPRAIEKEMYVSKLLHPFILPTIAAVRDEFEGDISFYFIQPFCENGDLYSALHGSNRNKALNMMKRFRILLQVALAIDFLHTPDTKTEKGVILHTDICSENILLDKEGNARLSDFGLARDKRDTTTTKSARAYYAHPDLATGKGATESWDYFSFAVVTLEMLTGQKPEGDGHKGYLKEQSNADIGGSIDRTVWPKDDDDSIDILTKIVKDCLQDKIQNFRQAVVNKLKGHSEMNKVLLENQLSVDRKCILCMVSKADSKAVEDMHKRSNCKEPFEICIGCEKRSHLFPVACHGCEGTLKPVIGNNWGALLVAGNDTDKDHLDTAITFKKDVEHINKIVTSKAPIIMGISNDNVMKIVPETPGTKTDLLPQFKEAMKWIEKRKFDTLFVYMSCHGKQQGGEGDSFLLGSDSEMLTTTEFQDELEKATGENGGKVRRVVLVLDRCFPSSIKLKYAQLIQLNSCRRDEKASIINKESVFTKYLIQGLKAAAFNPKGKLDRQLSCPNEYITISNLLDFAATSMPGQSPLLSCPTGLNHKDTCIAYNNPEEVTVDFHCDNENKAVSLRVDLSDDINYLKQQLRDLFEKRGNYEVMIRKDTYRKGDHVKCETVADILMASMFGERVNIEFLAASSHIQQSTTEQFCIYRGPSERKRKFDEMS